MTVSCFCGLISFSSVPYLFHCMWSLNCGANYGIHSCCVPTISCMYWILYLPFQPPKVFKKWSLSHFCAWAVLEDLSGAVGVWVHFRSSLSILSAVLELSFQNVSPGICSFQGEVTPEEAELTLLSCHTVLTPLLSFPKCSSIVEPWNGLGGKGP